MRNIEYFNVYLFSYLFKKYVSLLIFHLKHLFCEVKIKMMVTRNGGGRHYVQMSICFKRKL